MVATKSEIGGVPEHPLPYPGQGLLGPGRVPGPLGSGPVLPAIQNPTKLRVVVRWSDTGEPARLARVTLLDPEVPKVERQALQVKVASEDGIVTFVDDKDVIKPGKKYIVTADATRPRRFSDASLTVCLVSLQTGQPTLNATVHVQGPNGESSYQENNNGNCVTFSGLKPGKWIYYGTTWVGHPPAKSPPEYGSHELIAGSEPEAGHGEDGPTSNDKTLLKSPLKAGEETTIPIALLVTNADKGLHAKGTLHVNTGGLIRGPKVCESLHVVYPSPPLEYSVTLDQFEIGTGKDTIQRRVYDYHDKDKALVQKEAKDLLIRQINERKKVIVRENPGDEVQFDDPKYDEYWPVWEWDPMGKVEHDKSSGGNPQGGVQKMTWKWKMQIDSEAVLCYRVTHSTDNE